jgi:release factor glutamine methyltransferase
MSGGETVQTLLAKSIAFLDGKGVSEARRSAEMLLCEALRCKRIDLYLRFEQFVGEAELEIYRGHIRRRAKGEPVQYIVGSTEFYGLPFRVTPAVLIPRPETEHLVDRALELARPIAAARGRVRILDIGSGSGNIPIAIAKHCPEAELLSVDISADAIAVATANAEENGVSARVRFDERDALAAGALEAAGRFDLVVSNPPYIPAAEVAELQVEITGHEPEQAYTDRGDGFTFYRRIAQAAPAVLDAGGSVLCEIGFGQRDGIAAIFAGLGFAVCETVRDYSGIERILVFPHPQ